MTEQQRTKTAPEGQRDGYEHEKPVIALLRYQMHQIHYLSPYATTMGSDRGADIWIACEYVSAKQCRIVQRSRGAVLKDEGSKNGTYLESKRGFGLGLKPLFYETPVMAKGVLLTPGTTFYVADRRYRYVALDKAMHDAYSELTDILGSEDDVRDRPELVSPSDLLLAADSGGHMLIEGDEGCEQTSLARIVHRLSKRRSRRLVESEGVPHDWGLRDKLLGEATRATLLLSLHDNKEPIDPTFVSHLFSPARQIRVIALVRNIAVARAALGPKCVGSMMQVCLRPLAHRRPAIHSLLDRRLGAIGSPLRVADLTEKNQRALQRAAWRENLTTLQEATERLDAIIRAPNFSRNVARRLLGIARSTFYSWFGRTLRLSNPLVTEERARALRAELAAQRPLRTRR